MLPLFVVFILVFQIALSFTFISEISRKRGPRNGRFLEMTPQPKMTAAKNTKNAEIQPLVFQFLAFFRGKSLRSKTKLFGAA